MVISTACLADELQQMRQCPERLVVGIVGDPTMLLLHNAKHDYQSVRS
jgi:hypothetical protein